MGSHKEYLTDFNRRSEEQLTVGGVGRKQELSSEGTSRPHHNVLALVSELTQRWEAGSVLSREKTTEKQRVSHITAITINLLVCYSPDQTG